MYERITKRLLTISLVIIMVIATSNINAYAEEEYEPYQTEESAEKQAENKEKMKSKIKFIVGLGLTVTGIILIAYGLKKVDISEPEVDQGNWDWSKGKSGNKWYVHSRGDIDNTGNVDLKDVKVKREYIDKYGDLISTDISGLDVGDLAKGESSEWDYSNLDISDEPASVELVVEYEHDNVYKRGNTAKLLSGLALAGCGICVLIDFAVGKKLSAKLEDSGIEMKTTHKPGRSDFSIAKRF